VFGEPEPSIRFCMEVDRAEPGAPGFQCRSRQAKGMESTKNRGVRRPASVPQALPALRVETLGTNAGTSPPTPHSTLWFAFAATGAPLFPSIASVAA
jgi:hypothetical protein